MSDQQLGADPHGWNSLENYFIVHERRIQEWQQIGFVIEDGIASAAVAHDLILMEGRLICQDGIYVSVRKSLELDASLQRVRTVRYSYHVGITGSPDRTLFRYDNAHPHAGHPDEHHKHCFDHTTWDEIRPPQHVGREHWPHLSDVIEEAYGWWLSTNQPDR